MTRSKDVDPTGQFERAQAEVAGISHEAIPPKLDSIEPEAVDSLVELGPDGKEWAKKLAGYAHVESVVWKAFQTAPLAWYGHALREAFVAGAEWQEGRASPAPVAVPADNEFVRSVIIDLSALVRLQNGNLHEDVNAILSRAETALSALSASPVPSTATQAEAVTEALRDVTVHLIAACSLLSRSPKRAAPSDKMFDQMLADYQASAERGRAALASSPETARDRAEENAR